MNAYRLFYKTPNQSTTTTTPPTVQPKQSALPSVKEDQKSTNPKVTNLTQLSDRSTTPVETSIQDQQVTTEIDYPTNTLLGLPDELLLMIFKNITLSFSKLYEFINLTIVCKKFSKIAYDPQIISNVSPVKNYTEEYRTQVLSHLNTILKKIIDKINPEKTKESYIDFGSFSEDDKRILLKVALRNINSNTSKSPIDQFNDNIHALANLLQELNKCSFVPVRQAQESTPGAQKFICSNEISLYGVYDYSLLNLIQKLMFCIIYFIPKNGLQINKKAEEAIRYTLLGCIKDSLRTDLLLSHSIDIEYYTTILTFIQKVAPYGINDPKLPQLIEKIQKVVQDKQQ